MSKEPKRNVYVGHRYVPKVMGEWDKTETYEGLSIVTNKGTSYTSKKRVPKGVDILNKEYWVVTGNYNAQIEEYRKDVREMEKDFIDLDNNLNNEMNDLTGSLNKRADDLENNLNNELTDQLQSRIRYVNFKMFGLDGEPKYYDTETKKYYLDKYHTQEYTNDDSVQIKQAFEFANEHDLPVINPSGEYVLREERYIEVYNNVDFGNSIFHIDESTKSGNNYIFHIKSKHEFQSMPTAISGLEERQHNIPALSDYEGNTFIIEDVNDIVGWRHGNINNGTPKRDLFYVGQAGEIDGELAWNYNALTSVLYKKTDETFLIFTGGNFKYSGDLQGNTKGYQRTGIYITRDRVKVQNQMIDFEEKDFSYITGARMFGFYELYRVYDVTFENVGFKSRSEQGSNYGFTGRLATNIHFKNVRNISSNDYAPSFGTNEMKDVVVENTSINRFDTHFSLWNVTFKNTELNQLSITGGGTLYADQLKVKNRLFLNLRSDYGGTWNGDIIIKNSKAIVNSAGTPYIIFSYNEDGYDYGQDIYYGKKIIIDNFTFEFEMTSNNDVPRVYYTSGHLTFDGKPPFYPHLIKVNNVGVEGVDRGVHLMSNYRLFSTRTEHKNEYRTINGHSEIEKTNALFHFSNIRLEKFTNKNLDTGEGRNIYLDNDDSSPNRENSIVPEIILENCTNISGIFKLVANIKIIGGSVNKLKTNKESVIKLINTDIKSDFTRDVNYPNALEFNNALVSFNGVTIFRPVVNGDINGKIYHLGLFTYKWNDENENVTDLILKPINHIGTQFSPSAFNELVELTGSVTNANKVSSPLRNTPMSIYNG